MYWCEETLARERERERERASFAQFSNAELFAISFGRLAGNGEMLPGFREGKTFAVSGCWKVFHSEFTCIGELSERRKAFERGKERTRESGTEGRRTTSGRFAKKKKLVFYKIISYRSSSSVTSVICGSRFSVSVSVRWYKSVQLFSSRCV